LHTVGTYALLHSGSALGVGVGPLLVSARPLDMARLADYKIAIPGFKTTANLLLTLAHPEAKNKTELVFNEIEGAVLSGQYDAGLLIHEGRFTYQDRGLTKLLDLGDWWEQATGAAIPLGGIVIKRSLGPDVAARVDSVIKASLAYAWQRHPTLSHFITSNAQEMAEDVMRKHIHLYVNDYSTDLGPTGRAAITTLFSKASAAGLIEGVLPERIFY
jgi:1,4-dihydroxy-6-naphthoate synthase